MAFSLILDRVKSFAILWKYIYIVFFFNTRVGQKFCNILVVYIHGFFYNTRVSQKFCNILVCASATTQEYCEQYWTSHGDSTPQSSNYTVTYHPSWKHCWRSRNKLISDVLQWTPSHGWAKAGQPARTYIQQLCADIGCNSDDLPEAMDDREVWQGRVRNIHADGATWWWYHVTKAVQGTRKVPSLIDSTMVVSALTCFVLLLFV